MSVIIKFGILISSFSVASLATAATLESSSSWSHGSFWSVSGTNPDDNSCRYVGYVNTPNECAVRGYPFSQVSKAELSWQDFGNGRFGSREIWACFGCIIRGGR
jgi:hypothetical protein